jgi:hypothetical protein
MQLAPVRVECELLEVIAQAGNPSGGVGVSERSLEIKE